MSTSAADPASKAPNPSTPAAQTPADAVKAGLLPLAAQGVILLVTFLVGQLVRPSNGGGMQDVGAIAGTFFGCEIVLAVVCLVAATVRFRRGTRLGGVGLMGGWIVSLFVALLVINL